MSRYGESSLSLHDQDLIELVCAHQFYSLSMLRIYFNLNPRGWPRSDPFSIPWSDPSWINGACGPGGSRWGECLQREKGVKAVLIRCLITKINNGLTLHSLHFSYIKSCHLLIGAFSFYSCCVQRLAKVSRILGAIEKLLLWGIKKCYVDIWQPTLK